MSVYKLSNISTNWNTSIHGGGSLRGDLGGNPKLGHMQLTIVNPGAPGIPPQNNWNKTTQTITVSTTDGWADSGSLKFKIVTTTYSGGCDPGYFSTHIYNVSYTGRTGTQFTGVSGTRESCTDNCAQLDVNILNVDIKSANNCNVWFNELKESGSGHDITGSPAPGISCAVCHNPHGSNNAYGGNPYHFNDVITDDYSSYDNGAEWNGTWHPSMFIQTNWEYIAPNTGNLDPNVLINSSYINSRYIDRYYYGFNTDYRYLNDPTYNKPENNLSQLCGACHSTSGKMNGSSDPHHKDLDLWKCGNPYGACHVAMGTQQCGTDPVCLSDVGTFDDTYGSGMQNFRTSNENQYMSYQCTSCHSHGKAPKNRGGVSVPLF